MEIIRKFFIVVLAVFLCIGCNNPGGPIDNEEPGDPVDIVDGGLYEMSNSQDYPGAEVDLIKLLDGITIGDISGYASVIVDAVLYSDTSGETLAVKASAEDNLAQFKFLKATGSWDDSGNICGPTKYNMAIEGETVWNVPPGAQGIPAVLLLQANWAEFPNAVKAIRVKSIKFIPKASDIFLDVVFPENSSFLEISGNKITFTNATYSDCAAQFVFPPEWKAVETESLAGKTITFNFKIEEHSCVPSTSGTSENIEHQIHIQAAQNTPAKDLFNGKNPESGNDYTGQEYITLDDPAKGFNPATGTGSFTISANAMIKASKAPNSGNDGNGPFILDAVRICNNGTTWTESATVTHYRCKSYTLVFESITIH